METLGEFLQQARKGKGLHLEDIAARTRINIVYLRALEADQFDKFPSEVIARGFIRSYATLIGLDEKEILNRFDQSAQSFYRQQEEARHKLREEIKQAKAQETRRKHSGKRSLVFALSLTLAVLYWINSGWFLDSPSQPTPMQPATEMIPVQEEAPPPQALEMTQPFIPASQAGRPDELTINKPLEPSIFQPIPPHPAMGLIPLEEEAARPQASGAKQSPTQDELAVNKPAIREEGVVEAREPAFLTLTIEAVEPGWIAARIDDTVTKEVFLEPGEKVSWVAGDRFTLSLGNAGGVKIEFNGKPLKPFGPKGAVVKDIPLTRD